MPSLGTREQNGFDFISAVWDRMLNDYLYIYYLKKNVFGTVVPHSPNLSAPSFIRWNLKIFQGWNFENVTSGTKYFQVGCYPYFFSGQDTYPLFQKSNIFHRFIGETVYSLYQRMIPTPLFWWQENLFLLDQFVCKVNCIL